MSGAERIACVIVLFVGPLIVSSFEPRPEIGYPAGLIPECPGVTKNASISPVMMQMLQITVHRMSPSGQVSRKEFPILSAHKTIPNEKHIDFKNKKTMIYAVGFLDSSVYPQSQAIGTAYSKRGYNVLITETFAFLTYIYPKSVRLTRTIGRKVGEFLVKLTEHGLTADNLELVGASLGAHVVSHAAKYFYKATGQKPSRLTGLDPAGPCYRSLPVTERFDKSDAQRVDVIHSNIDGFGIAERLGHIDFYANGGEYQPSDIPYIPCLVICSHVRAILYWWQAIEHPKKFIGVQCDSVQDARLAKCYNNTLVNYLGLAADFTRPGIYYLPTHNEFPYYRGKEGLKAENEIYKSTIRMINSDDMFVVSVRLTRTIGRKVGEFLVKLTEHGLTADNLELVGASLGAHVVSHAAKYFYKATGQKPSRLTGLDPAGPCYRSLPVTERFDKSDAQRVDVIHSNIDGFGIAERLGHIDFYANGGEYQPSDIPYIPCLVICSHVRAILYWWQAIEHPKKFIGVQCDSVQDARLAKCYNNTLVNYLGLAADFTRPGIYYLPTHNEFPYYRGKEGLKAENEIYKSTIRMINSDDMFVV